MSRGHEGGPSVGVGAPIRKHHRASSNPRPHPAGSLLSHLQPPEASEVNIRIFKPPVLRCSVPQPELTETAAPHGPRTLTPSLTAVPSSQTPVACYLFTTVCHTLVASGRLGRSHPLMMSRQFPVYYAGPCLWLSRHRHARCPPKTLGTGAQEKRPPATVTGPGGAEPGSGHERSGPLGKLRQVEPGAAREGTDMRTARTPGGLSSAVCHRAWPASGLQAAC